MPKSKKQQSYKLGVISEFIAIIFLRLKGYKILKRRYKTYVGEIDLIAKKADFLIAIEVKSRSKKVNFDEVLSVKQQQRIKRAMLAFLSANSNKFKNYNVRFDLIIVVPYQIPKHFQGFWE